MAEEKEEKRTSKKILTTIKKLAFALFVLIAASIGGVLGREAVNSFFFSEDTNEITESTLKSFAEKMNEQLPMMIDEETQLMNVAGSKNTVSYNYKLMNYKAEEIDKGGFEKSMRPNLLKNYCTNEDMEAFRENGIQLKYSYSGKEDKEFSKLTILAEECQN